MKELGFHWSSFSTKKNLNEFTGFWCYFTRPHLFWIYIASKPQMTKTSTKNEKIIVFELSGFVVSLYQQTKKNIL